MTERVLVVGGGSIGERHARCFLTCESTTVSVCDHSAAIRDTLTAKYALDSVYESFEDVLTQDWDAAVVCTPAHLHVPMAKQLLERRIPTLIEKPLSTTDEGVGDLLKLSRETPVSVAYVLRGHQALNQVREAIRSGRFGAPVQVVAVSGQHFPYYRPAYREIYYNSRKTGGGAIQDALTHLLNAAEWLVGPTTRVVADADHLVLEGVDVEDTAHLLTRHGAVLGSFSLNQHQHANESTLTVLCERGAVRLELHNARWLWCNTPDSGWEVGATFTTRRDALFEQQARAFLELVRNGGDNPCSLSEARQTMRAALAALQSLESGQWVSIPTNEV